MAALAVLAVGCATSERWIERRPTASALSASVYSLGPKQASFSPVTAEVATSRGLDPLQVDQRQRLLGLLEAEAATNQTPEQEFALSELAAAEAERLAKGEPDLAAGFYAESLVHGYRALAGDPQRQVGGVTQRYNRSLAALLRILRERDAVRPGAVLPLPSSRSVCSVAVELHSRRWTEADFQRFEFADDFQVLGLRNHYHRSGVGVPLIAIRLHEDRDHAEDRHYPRQLCYPLTAFVRAEAAPAGVGEAKRPTRLVLELHDPTDHAQLTVAGRRVAMESDLTTPLAYYLDQPDLQDKDVSTLGLLEPERAKEAQGLYLLEPFDPDRIPVVMVHGLWSSPCTWMEMFNDLRSDPLVQSRYQFWFYQYPTGNPFWVSAQEFRDDLRRVRQTFDPDHKALALDQMVLVGHSMGGLVSRLQTVDSGQDFWKIVSDRDFDQLDAEPEVRQKLREQFFFQPEPAVRRVVTIGTPHRGSRFANGVTRWVGAKLIALPMQSLAKRQEIYRRNPDFFRPQVAAQVMTSIDSLSPDSPVLSALLAAQPAPWVSYHNVVGDQPRSGVTSWVATRGDGVVSLASARLDDLARLESQIVVPEDHVTLHRHPQAIEEVRRVLVAQLAEYGPVALTRPGDAPDAPVVRMVSAAN